MYKEEIRCFLNDDLQPFYCLRREWIVGTAIIVRWSLYDKPADQA